MCLPFLELQGERLEVDDLRCLHLQWLEPFTRKTSSFFAFEQMFLTVARDGTGILKCGQTCFQQSPNQLLAVAIAHFAMT